MGINALVTDFNHSLAALMAPLPSKHPASTLAIALSGGSDSMALLHLTRQCLPDTPLIALTVDHQLRPESTQEAEHVAAWINDLDGVTHRLLRWERPSTEPLAGNLQAQARQARYRLLAEAAKQAGTPAILLGHTQDDQAETIALMQARGAGVVGLAGMSAQVEKHGVTFLRPLLAHRRQALRDWLTAQEISWVDDPSNENEAFDRIRIRRELASDAKRAQALLTLGHKSAQARQMLEQAHADFVQAFVVQQRDDSQ